MKDMSRVLIYDVEGMTCASCERLIGNALREIPNVQDVEVSLTQERAAIRLVDDATDPDLALLNGSLKSHGYVLYAKGTRPVMCEVSVKKDRFSTRLKRAVLALLLMTLVLIVLGPLRKIVPSVNAGASLGAMFALGLVASVSTCLASTGGFLLAYTSRNPSKKKTMMVHAGRLIAFVIGGAILGAIGGALPEGSGAWYGVLALVLGVGFLLAGLNLLDLSPSLARFGIRLPSKLNILADRVSASSSPVAPFLVGAVTFILPCGFTQTAQALALASGSPARGLLYMGVFALGTLPVLLGVSFFGSTATLKHRSFRLAAGAMLTFFAFGQMDGGLTVLGSPVTFTSLASSLFSKSIGAIPVANAEEQVVRMTVAYGTYDPKNLVVKKGVPVRWEIDGKEVYGCANSIVVPKLGIKKSLTTGLNVIQFTPKEKGTLPFSCSMGMIRGSFTVTD
ncbi:MAG: sulfite exporter TauE/SafE family protein [Patescibacteria group bacterium]|jgi:sulfite exporter TauE/SafE/copper chaperone CopZ